MTLWMQIVVGIIVASVVLAGMVIVLAALGEAERNRDQAEHMERLKNPAYRDLQSKLNR